MTQLRTGLRWGLGLLVVVGLLGMPDGTWGQTLSDVLSQGEMQVVASSPTPRTFGTAGSTAHVIGATEFETFGPGAWNYAGLLAKWSAVSALFAAVRLPAGAVVNAVELEGCDTNTGAQALFSMSRRPSPNGPAANVTPTGSTGFTGAPGCGFFTVTPLPAVSPLVIDNENNTYHVEVSATTSTTTLIAVRVYYTLQVSPAPSVATFSDVPTSHPFFRFVEALARSGITSGCGGGNYCPDAPLTRGQMAVFLSLGLGLHFAP
jgi:hypothetical protein